MAQNKAGTSTGGKVDATSVQCGSGEGGNNSPLREGRIPPFNTGCVSRVGHSAVPLTPASCDVVIYYTSTYTCTTVAGCRLAA